MSTERKGCPFLLVTHAKVLSAHQAVSGDVPWPEIHLLLESHQGPLWGLQNIVFVLLLLEYRIHKDRAYPTGVTTLRIAIIWPNFLVIEAPRKPTKDRLNPTFHDNGLKSSSFLWLVSLDSCDTLSQMITKKWVKLWLLSPHCWYFWVLIIPAKVAKTVFEPQLWRTCGNPESGWKPESETAESVYEPA